jgi:alpha-amylase/alpha-mannosidase (GH57 family)
VSETARTSLVVHGHFYQPPREDPWTGVIEDQPGAAPFANWNERILAECYRANAFARIHDGEEQRVVNNYERLSFNFGPTLLAWLKPHDPETYARILAADRASAEARAGHGNAIAQSYHHTILPLMLARDRRTEIRWGIADFRHRFRRDPEAVWLPETAADDATLGDLIDAGMRYAILAPRQAARVRPVASKEWQEVSGERIDPSRPCRYRHPDGSARSLALFFYDGPLARAVAFENALLSSGDFVNRIEVARDHRPLVHLATDGETYGHHVKFADLTLAHALVDEAPARGLVPTNYGEALDRLVPGDEVEIDLGAGGEGSSWSCEHGLARWQRDCGCSTGGEPEWNQAWRAPLRAALDGLRDRAHADYDAEMSRWFADPWALRDDSIRLRLLPASPGDVFLREHARRDMRLEEQARALLWLEIERHVLMMYTSCGWFFSDLAGIETVQVLAYAGRALQLLEQVGVTGARTPFLAALAEAHSNRPEEGTGAAIFERYVVPRMR